MQNAAVPADDVALSYPSPLKEFWQGFSYNKGAVAGLIFMSIVVLCAVWRRWWHRTAPSSNTAITC
jgi:dipeptide transport system permease protein